MLPKSRYVFAAIPLQSFCIVGGSSAEMLSHLCCTPIAVVLKISLHAAKKQKTNSFFRTNQQQLRKIYNMHGGLYSTENDTIIANYFRFECKAAWV
ncbi:hypothetical protein [Prevotella aurantiaca]|uniref:hypothetical protein n=1 Tax=Prevotella aurantiaca TaxID=596085 RepID=UPI00288B3470|nr:hypothetical protein [Prevotella aurantiaca]